MSRRIELLIAAVLLLALAGSLAIQTLAARQALQWQLEARNREAASALAWSLSQQQGHRASLLAIAAAQFDRGHYGSLRLIAGDGQVLLALRQNRPAGRAPAWFESTLPLVAAPGSAPVSDGGREIGRLEVASHTAWAHDALWDACRRTAVLLALLWLAAGGLALWLLRRWRRSLQATVAQAQALEHGRLVEAEEPQLPELGQLMHSLNATVRRLREAAGAQAEQLIQLQRQAQLDAVTGLPLRQHFVSQLQDQLNEPGASGSALVLVRVSDLETLNSRLGYATADRVLCAVADVLQTYVERVSGTLAGRLNGSDFGLSLPVAGVAAETATSIHATLAAAPALRDSGAELAVGAADGLFGITAGAALAEADAALARAEAGSGVAVDGRAGVAVDPAGARAWRDQIAGALAAARTLLAEAPVLAPDGSLLHLECTLRMQLEPAGEFLHAVRWLPLASRSRLMPEVDLATLDLALRAIAADGRARAVGVSQASATLPGFANEVARCLQAAPAAARLLALEWVDARRPVDARALAEAAALWHRHGARVGVAHAGASLQRLRQLNDAGIDYIKVDASHVREVASNEAVRAYAQSLVGLLRGLGLQTLAAGVDETQDLAVLWALGFDGASGPAVGPHAEPTGA